MADSQLSNKIVVASRYLGSNATGALTLAVVLGALSPEQQTQILSSVHVMYQATHDFVGAFANIWYIVFPVLAVYLTKLGINSSGIGTMMNKVFAAAKAGDVGAKVAIVNAAASPDIGSQGVINKEMASNPATSDNVVAMPSQLPPKAA
jgi:hypothetical protein